MSLPEYKAAPEKSLYGEDIAIIGMACIFPGAPNIKAYWENIVTKRSAIADPPDDWGADLAYDPDSQANDRVYSKRGGYLGELARFNPLDYGIMPLSVDGGEPDQYLALRLAFEAMTDAGYADGHKYRNSTEVIIGRGTYVNRGWTTLVQHGLIVDQTIEILKKLHPEHSPEELETVKKALKASLPPFNAETASGLVPNIITGRIANRLDIMGPNYIVDAACASSLIAVDLGVRDLLSGRCDVALVGGVQASTPPPLHMIFCQLNALSRRSEIRPFDKDADGTLLGEGAGMVLLKRRADAERDGDRIYALIKGVGTSSDGRGTGVMTPRVEGEELALRQAYQRTGISPDSIELIEAHGTGTPIGDLTEIQALTRVFGFRKGGTPRCALGSVKSMISHLIPAAGIAGLIKVALSLYHKVLPPTLNCSAPNPKFELEKTTFYINTETRPWIHGSPQPPRRAGVNSFGFGGVNAHAILEEYIVGSEHTVPSYHHQWDTEVFILEGTSREALIRRVQQILDYVTKASGIPLKDLAYTLNVFREDMPYRLSVVASSLQDLQKKLAQALKQLMHSACSHIKDIQGIYFFEQPLHGKGKLAFVFPGEGSQYINMLSDLCIHFSQVRQCFDRIDCLLSGRGSDYLPSGFIFPPPAFSESEKKVEDNKLWEMDGAVEAVLTANEALFTLLRNLGINPDVILGHSTGEYSAMQAAGVFSLIDSSNNGQPAIELKQAYANIAASKKIPRAHLIAVTADSEKVKSYIARCNATLHIAMDNCPHQTVIAGSEVDARKAVEEMSREGIICQVLPFDRPYHTPLFKDYAETLQQLFERWSISSPATMIYSCTTAAPFPSDPQAIRKIAVEHWVSPVRFKDTIERMYADGVRIFVEVGPKGNLTSFIDDILRDGEHLAVAANVMSRSGINQLNRMVGMLAAQGVPMSLDYLYARRMPQKLSLDPEVDSACMQKDARGSMKLSLGLPHLHVAENIVAEVRSKSTVSSNFRETDPALLTASNETDSPLWQEFQNQGGALPPDQRAQAIQEYFNTMESFLNMQHDVMQSFLKSTGHADLLASMAIPITSATSSLMGTASDVATRTDSSIAAEVHSVKSSIPSHQQSGNHSSVTMTETSVQIENSGAKQVHNVRETASGTVASTLLALVSEKTGYPIEMLNLELDMEADLGIDSIKRTEIIGALNRCYKIISDQEIEKVVRLKTLQQLVDFFKENMKGDSKPSGGHVQPTTETGLGDSAAAPLATGEGAVRYPFIDEIVSHVPGKNLVALRRISLDEDLHLKDHTIGGRVSSMDDTLRPLPVMPLTLSMEILAEGASILVPSKKLIGMKNIRAHTWIAIEEGTVTLKIDARRIGDASSEVEVKIYNLDADKAIADSPVIEGTMIFGDTYPEPPVVDAFSLHNERNSKWTSEQLYTEAMFHGPCWQGVASVDRWGEDGSIATLKVLPANSFFHSQKNPGFVTDPIVLDAAGQVIGFWTMEHLTTGFLIFPFKVKALQIYRPQLPVHQKVRCQARIQLVGNTQVLSDIDMIGDDGHPWMRLEGWEDKRFSLPTTIYPFLLAPIKIVPSRQWKIPFASFPDSSALYCFCLETIFAGDEVFWRKVFSHLILNHRERSIFRNLGKSAQRQTQWLMGRLAAKDAVRMLLKEHHGIEAGPADIEIETDEYGRPVPVGAWSDTIEAMPVVSLAHTNGRAVALACNHRAGTRIGIDIEQIQPLGQDFEKTAFTPSEEKLLASIKEADRLQWVFRFWCAKEAVAKALGRGLIEGPQSLSVKGLDAQTGTVQVALQGKLADTFPDLAHVPVVVHTHREDNYIFTSTICQEALE